MKMNYDIKEDAIYIELAKGKYDRSKKISEYILVDEDKKGKILGIEILEAKKNIPDFNPKKVVISTQVS